MPDQHLNIGSMNISGGQQSLGGRNTNIQNNYAAPADQVRDLLAAIRDHHPDPVYAGAQVAAITEDIREGTPEARTRVQDRLRALASSAADVQEVTTAGLVLGGLIAANWPF
ncbi:MULTISPECIES: hypothetical protein [Actinoplanes]|uniref:hypothetical protein n=1 Tax=Actinoplanes TaxID=1865 RepID=UPI0005F278A2|nr:MULTISPECIES: hypothetical protein [Actinoplanes]GLY04024.1 hypothetical protein Acsp01_44030 [Actinoplanes sp. NBRC 101535]